LFLDEPGGDRMIEKTAWSIADYNGTGTPNLRLSAKKSFALKHMEEFVTGL
jgi:hypothetical protein